MSLRTLITKKGGFTALEIVIAIAIFSILVLVMAKTLTSVTYAVEQTGNRRKAATLAGMVLEQYDAYAAGSYDALVSYDCDQVPPRQFFGGDDNLGYDGFTITTRSECAPEESTCQVTVTIGSGQGVHARTVAFTKNYDENSLGVKTVFGSGL